jgi:sRNA-binding protein
MGIFKSYGELKTMTKEISNAQPAGSQSERALERVKAANAQMAQMAASVTAQPAAGRAAATATIINVQDTGQRINMQSILQIDTVVLVPGQAPFPATHRELVPPQSLSRIQVGATIAMNAGATPAEATIDWARC